MTFIRTGDPWVPSTTPEAPVRLFCLPYAGGGASAYRPWATQMPARVQLCPIQLPGREERLAHRPFTRVSTLVPELAQTLERYLDRPYAFFGHSMGALVAFELARHLRSIRARLPKRLFFSGHRGPSLPGNGKVIHTLDDRHLVDELRRLRGTPEEILTNDELIALTLPTVRADFELCETYRHVPDAPLDVPVTVMGGRDDPEVPIDCLDAWNLESTSSVRFRIFAGGHFYWRTSPSAITAAIAQDLEV